MELKKSVAPGLDFLSPVNDPFFKELVNYQVPGRPRDLRQGLQERTLSLRQQLGGGRPRAHGEQGGCDPPLLCGNL